MISVIVPVYKVKEFLPFCVQSIQMQTYSDWELILVDDGSPDCCGGMCDQFACQDPRIRVVHKTNGGLADARNAGTALALGEYIVYVDSDDWVAPQMLELLLTQAQSTGADVVACDLLKTSNEDVTFPPAYGAVQEFTGPQAMERMLYQTSFDTSACGKLYCAELVKKFPFPKGKLYEDLFTVYKILFAARRVVWLPQVLYAYRKNPDSIMNRSFDCRNLDELDAADEIVAFVQHNCPQYLPAANSRKFSSYSQVLKWMKKVPACDTSLEKTKQMIWKFLKEYRMKMLLDRHARKKNRMAAACAFLGHRVYILL